MNRPMRMAASGKVYKWAKYYAVTLYVEESTGETMMGAYEYPPYIVFASTSGAYSFDSTSGVFTLTSGNTQEVGLPDGESLIGKYVPLNSSLELNLPWFEAAGYGIGQVTGDALEDSEYRVAYKILHKSQSYRTPGTFLGYVYSTDPNAYPNNGEIAGYWYSKLTT